MKGGGADYPLKVKMKKTIFGLLLIIVAIAGIFFWEAYGREAYMYDEVLTLNQDVEENTLITEDMLAKKKVNEAHVNSYKVKDAETIIGKEATQFIPMGTELFEQYFEDERLSVHPDEDEYVLSIPNDWLESYPQSLRRGDTVYFYCEGKKVTSATVVYVKDSSNTEVTSDDDRLSASSTVSLVEIIATGDQAEKLSKYAEDDKKFVLLYN